MTKQLTRITPVINGFAVVVAQEPNQDGKPGAFIGCFLQTPECANDGPLVSLTEAMNAYIQKTEPQSLCVRPDAGNKPNLGNCQA